MFIFFSFSALFAAILLFQFPINILGFSLIFTWSLWPFFLNLFKSHIKSLGLVAFLSTILIIICIVYMNNPSIYDYTSGRKISQGGTYINLSVSLFGFGPIFLEITQKSLILTIIAFAIIYAERCIYDNYNRVSEKKSNTINIFDSFFLSHQHNKEKAIFSSDKKNAFAIMELDEQGILYNENHLDEVFKWININSPSIILTFNHGWRQNAQKNSSSGDNLKNFRTTFEKIVYQETQRNPNNPRSVLAIFFAWQGKSYPFPFDLLTFWGRSRRVGIVAQGTLREIHARLSIYRNKKIAEWEKEKLSLESISGNDLRFDTNPINIHHMKRPVLIHIGHSFGAYMLYSCQAQALMEAAVDDAFELKTADMIILLNPAFAATLYLPIHQALERRSAIQAPRDVTIFMSLSSTWDIPTKIAFRIGKLWSIFVEGFSDADQRRGINTTIGNMKKLQTHTLYIPEDQKNGNRFLKYERFISGNTKELCPELKNVPGKNNTPFKIIKCGAQTSKGHGDIFGDKLSEFILSEIIINITP